MAQQRRQQAGDRRVARVAERMAHRPAGERIGQDDGAATTAHEGVDRDQVVGRKRRRMREEQRSEEHTSELQSLMRISYAVFCLKKTNKIKLTTPQTH